MPQLSLQDIEGKEGFIEAVELYRKAKAPRKIFQASKYTNDDPFRILALN